MDYRDGLLMRPGEVSDATRQLAELADRIKQVMDTEAANLTVVASGRDEVSQRVATTLNDVHASFAATSDRGQQQLREVTANLRAHTGNVVAADEGLAV